VFLRGLAIVTAIGATALAICVVVFSAHPEQARSALPHAIVIWTLPLAILVAMTRLPAASRPAALIGAIVTLTALDAVWSAALSGPLLHATNDAWYRTSELRYQDLDLTRRGLARALESPDNANLWHKVPVLRSYTPFRNVQDETAWYEHLSRHPVFERAATQADRIFFAKEAPLVAVRGRVFAALLDRASAVHAPVLAVQTPDEMIAPAPVAAPDDARVARDAALIAALPAAEPIAVHVDRYEPEELTVTTTTPAAGWLLVTDRWARGWKATVNGAPVSVYVGDFVFRAVQVPAGRVRVRFTYEKSHGLWLVALSWITCGVLLIGVPLVRAGTKLTRA
jgi:hypothetical protein